MKIGVVDIDSKIPNLALMKLSAHHKQKGHGVELTSPLFADQYDMIFASKVFDYTPMPILPECSIVGGSGISLKIELDKPIESLKPDYNLYPDTTYSLGFTTRGCIRKCPFCIVPEKEGKLRVVADIHQIWNGKDRDVVLLDNNILGLPDHFFKITTQIKELKLKVDFNQGLDHRLLTKDVSRRLSEISHVRYRFAFDDIRHEKNVLKALRTLREVGINISFWYVLVGFNSTLEEDFYRINLLRGHNQDVYVQRYNYRQERIYLLMAQWANQHHIFRTHTWNQFLEKRGVREGVVLT